MAKTVKGHLSKAQKYERQKELTKERVRRHRERMSEENLEKKRKYDRDRYKKLKEENKIKPIAELKRRAQRALRKTWKKNSAKYRLKKRNEKSALENTPPESETDQENSERPVLERKKSSSQKARGRKLIRKDRASAYRKIVKQDERIKILERRLKKYQKRLEREQKKRKSLCSPSPNTKVSRLLQREKVSPLVKKRLFIGYALEKQLETQLKKTKARTKERAVTKRLIGSEMLRKYRVQRNMKHIVNYEANRGKSPLKKQKYASKVANETSSLKAYFESDTVSRMCPGKKDVKRLGKIKKQRRVLVDSMKHLYRRYVQENASSISYTSFTRARPFWVVPPQARDRDTCACVTHCNMELLVSSLKGVNAIAERSTWEVLKSTVCSIKNELCMMEKCQDCKHKKVEFNCLANDVNIKLHQWKTVTETKVIKGIERKIKKVVKGKEVHDLNDLKQKFNTLLSKFKKHVFDMFHQANHKKETKENLQEGELMFLFDFSENYNAKYAKEIQSMHFGASKKQISLHTGIRYHNDNGKIIAKGFCTVSDCLDHQSHGVWAHLDPILKDTAALFPLTDTVHIFSDSPSSQYRNRNNLYLFKTLLPGFFPSLRRATWNFSEPGHGKGPMDGIGGTLKRRADEHVLHHQDITCSKQFVDVFKDTSKVMVLEVPTSKVEYLKTKLQKEVIPPVKSIMKIKQITYYKGNMQGRTLSCSKCSENVVCTHYTLVKSIFQPETDSRTFPEKKAKKKKLRIENVYTESEDDQADETPGPSGSVQPYISLGPATDELKTGEYVLVRYITKKATHQYVGICLSCDEEDEEGKVFEVIFLKSATSENKKTFMLNDKDVAYISANQIVACLPPPTITQKGSRNFYEFKRPIDVY